MCKRCAGLIELLDEKEEEIRQLKDLLGYRYDREKPEHGLTRQEWRIFRSLEDHQEIKALEGLCTSGVPRERLFELMEERGRKQSGEYVDQLKALQVIICKIRRKVKPLGLEIQPVWRWGYVLKQKKIDATCAWLLVDRNKEAA